MFFAPYIDICQYLEKFFLLQSNFHKVYNV